VAPFARERSPDGGPWICLQLLRSGSQLGGRRGCRFDSSRCLPLARLCAGAGDLTVLLLADSDRDEAPVNGGPWSSSVSTARSGLATRLLLCVCGYQRPGRRPDGRTAQVVMVTGMPGPMRVASQVIACVSSLMHPWEAAGPRTPPMLFVP
jgi:hypothetical protein